ncbi:hypothetical protein PSPO01_08243 [Paraphaeosphaeria sporulosa]
MASFAPLAASQEFQPKMSPGVTREHLPRLALCLEHLEQAYGIDWDTSEIMLLTLVHAYSAMVHYASHMATEGPSSDLNRNINHCKNVMWPEYVQLDQQMHAHGGCTAELPTSEDIWNELCESFLHIDVDVQHYNAALDLCGETVICGTKVKYHELYAFEYIQHCDGKYTPLIMSYIGNQPVYTDLPSDYDRYVTVRLAGGDPFIGLNNALRPFLYDKNNSLNTLVLFGSAVAYTVDLFKKTSFTPSPEQVNILTDEVAYNWTRFVENMWQGVSKSARKHIATINSRGVTEALVHRARELLQHHPSQHLAWYLYAWVFERAVAAFSGVIPHGQVQAIDGTAWVKDLIRSWEKAHPDLIDNPNHAQSDYHIRSLDSCQLNRSQLEAANQLDRLEDVPFNPVGPPLDPLQYTNAIQVSEPEELCAICQCEFGDEPTVQLRACGHIMHRDCVGEMINQVTDNSNLCALDRRGICPRRPRAPAP